MKISKDNPSYFLTSVTLKRLRVFRTDKLKAIAVKALDEARQSAGISIFAYVIMPDHYHLLTDSRRKISETLHYLNGITARRIIDYLKENDFQSSLLKLRRETGRRRYRYSLWAHHPNAFSINNERTFLQKINYIHQNPVQANLSKSAEDYLYSSGRIWHRKSLANEPLEVDLDEIEWREAEPR